MIADDVVITKNEDGVFAVFDFHFTSQYYTKINADPRPHLDEYTIEIGEQ